MRDLQTKVDSVTACDKETVELFYLKPTHALFVKYTHIHI